MPDEVRVDVDKARKLCGAAYQRHGVPAEDAARATEQFIVCDLLGIPTHGLRRLSNYIGRIEIGGINPKPDIQVTSRLPAVAVMEGDGGLGTVVASRGLEEGIRRAKDNGIAYVSCINSNHFGGNASYGWSVSRAATARQRSRHPAAKHRRSGTIRSDTPHRGPMAGISYWTWR